MIRNTAAIPSPPELMRPAASGSDAARAATGEPARAVPAPVLPNPTLRIEAELNLVVLEFRDGAGEVSRTIPSAREIDAYRSGTAETDGTEPRAASLDVTR